MLAFGGGRQLLLWSAVAFLAGLLVTMGWRRLSPAETRRVASPAVLAAREPGYAGTYLVMVYFGSPSCSWSTRADLAQHVRAVRGSLHRRARTLGVRFHAVGVALGNDPDRGLALLRRIGEFDEVAAGGNWLNAQAIRYLWADVPGVAATPQIVVLRREVVVPVGNQMAATLSVQGERLLARKVGFPEIATWARLGAPVPDLRLPDQVRAGTPRVIGNPR